MGSSPAVGLLGAPASIPLQLGPAARFASASAASRIESRIDPSHCTPRRQIGVDEARDWPRRLQSGWLTRIAGRLSP
jgi:hypothetical protein